MPTIIFHNFQSQSAEQESESGNAVDIIERMNRVRAAIQQSRSRGKQGNSDTVNARK